jgi:hypothetical protein
MDPIIFERSNGEQPINVTFVDCPNFLEYSDVAEQLYSSYARITESTDVLIVRAPVDRSINDIDLELDNMQPFSNRFPRASIHLLSSSDFSISISKNCNANAIRDFCDEVTSADFVEWLRESELRYYAVRSSALLSTPDNFSFHIPSGRCVRNFLRVGSIQLERRTLDAVFFWLLPFLRNCDGILTETWSISSIALNAARLLERYAANINVRCRVDMLSTYHDGSALLDQQMEVPFQRVCVGNGAVVVLISAVMTGRSLSNLQEYLTKLYPHKEVRFVAIYKLSDSVQIDALCNFFGYAGAPNFEYIDRPPLGTHVVTVDSKTYFPLAVKENSVGLSPSCSKPNRPFFDKFAGTKALTLHRDSFDSFNLLFRHHGIYVDVEAMLNVPSFRASLLDLAASLSESPALLITPPHNAGDLMARLLTAEFKSRYDKEPRVLSHPDLGPSLDAESRALIRSLDENQALVILDDVSVTGKRLSRYQLHLRSQELDFKGRIHYWIGVARPESQRQWADRVMHLSYRIGYPKPEQHSVVSLETVTLPDWTHKTCPWCVEIQHLGRIIDEAGIQSGTERLIKDRLRLLMSVHEAEGLSNDAIWCLSEERPKLTPNSLIMDDTNALESDVISAVAAALHHLRSIPNTGNRLGSAYPFPTLVGIDDHLGQKFNDMLLRLAIIRSSQRKELTRWDDSEEERRRERVRELLLLPEAVGIWPELALNILDRKLPPPVLSEHEQGILSSHPAGGLLWWAIQSISK